MKQITFKARLTKKTFRSFLVNHLTYRYKFSPAVSEVLSEDSIYLREILNPKARRDGQIIYYAVDLREPAGKALADCRYYPVKLTLRDENDIKYREEKGLKELKLLVLQRITEEAVTQGACLTHEDIASLLYLDRGTVSDYIAELRSRGIEVRTRSSFTDQGRGITHRENVIKLYLQNYTETEISQRTKHVMPCVENYIDKFLRIGLCYRKGDDIGFVARTTKCSIETVKENITLYEKLWKDPQYRTLLDKTFQFYESELILGGGKKELR